MQEPSANSPQSETKKIGALMLAFMWLGIFIILGFLFSDILDKQNNPNQSISTHTLPGDIKELVLKRNKMGHYVANGSINSQPVVFMLDTGATQVAIPDAIARRLNLSRDYQSYSNTANGTATVYLTKLDSISLGDITLNNISATIVPGYKSNEVLLGMSFLKHLEFSQRGDTLTLKQYPDGL